MHAYTTQLDSSILGNTLAINPPASQYNTTYGGERVLRCAIYARVSTEMDSQKTSIDNQIDLFRRYAFDNGWQIVEIYKDNQSGTKSNRPGLISMIEDGKAGKYDVILAKELSRLARNGKLSYDLRDTCQQNNIHIVCLDNSINTISGDVGNFGLFAWLYENESASSSRRNKAAQSTKAKNGFFIGSVPPYGYSSNKGKLVIREDNTPEIVRRIFTEYLQGKGMDSIARDLTAESVPTPSQVARKSNASPLWHASSIKLILNNQHYCGDLVQNKTETISVTTNKRKVPEKATIIEATHEPIISKEIFQSVKKMLQSRTRTTTAPKKHLFTNVLYCECCQKGMWYKANQKGYKCGGNLKHGDIFCLNRTVIREQALKQIILEDIQELIKSISDDQFMTSLQARLDHRKITITKELGKIENNVSRLHSRKKDYLDMYADNLLTRDELLEYREQLDKELIEVEKSKTELQEKLTECESENYAIDLGKKLEGISVLDDLTPQVLHSLVSKVTCSLDGNLSIHYNFVKPF
ncbi:recombinase family protein [Sutcliffiella horikoshii]|uniref:recombinase family protein n=1 Tax=Sutcliffiella horikoshii TaxID=79883 RepID=UPI003CFA62E4